MREKETADQICPYCGFDRDFYEKKRSARSLPTETILNGKYLLGRVLGEGGFGITYLAVDLILEIPVAVKEYFPMGLASRNTSAGRITENISTLTGEKKTYYEHGLRSFMDEARNLAKFQKTEGVISVKDFFLENNTAYLVMEYLEGKTLQRYLDEKRLPLSEKETLNLMWPVLKALSRIHKEGMIHRDISPDNIMIANDGRVVLIDFGAARISTGAETKSLTVLLKHGYAPAEQYQTKGRQGPYTDIYAVCATMYRMMSGKVPEEAIDRMVEDHVVPLEQWRGLNISYQVSRSIKKGLSVKPQDRYLTVEDLIEDLYGKAKADNRKIDQRKPQSLTEKKIWKIGIGVALSAVALLCAICVILIKNNIKSDEKAGEVQKERSEELSEKDQTNTEEYTAGGSSSENIISQEAQESQPIEEKQTVLVSKRMWEENETVYTVYDVQKPGYVSISGHYMDTMLVYNGRIYWRETAEDGTQKSTIISMDLDGTDQTVLSEKASPSTALSIANGCLYYVALDEMENKKSRKIDLQTGEEEEAPEYMLRSGNNEVWFSTSLSDSKWYSSDPGFENIQEAREVKGTLLGVVGGKAYYMQQQDNGTYTTYSYDSITGQKEVILKDQTAKSLVNGNGLYYKKVVDGETVLYRMDLKTGSQEEYNLGDFHLYMGGGLYELEHKICIMRFVPEQALNNTEFWEISRETGQKELIGQWYNSNAENAAKEP